MKKEKGFWIRKERFYYVFYCNEPKTNLGGNMNAMLHGDFETLYGLKCKQGESFFIPQVGLKKIAKLIKE